MKIYIPRCIGAFIVANFIFIFPCLCFSLDITEELSISGTLTGVYQWLNKVEGNFENEDRGSGVIDFAISFRPIPNGELSLRASFAEGDGLKEVNPFSLNPNADDLYHDLKDINGHKRDYLLELWYSHNFEIKKDVSIKLTSGIIDSTSFIDGNSYAGDEIHQFMNEALVHNPLANLPSYDAGAAVEFELDKFHLRVVGIRSKNENEVMDVRNYTWIGAQAGYSLETPIGEGNYRLYAYTTNKRFENWTADIYKSLKGIGLSFDQQIIKDFLGAFFRAGWQDDSAKVDYNRMYSLGLNLDGSIWGRKDDEVGIGYTYLKSPSRSEELSRSQVFEGYVKFKLLSYKFLSSEITLDYQYIRDRTRESDNDKAGHVYGIRLNLNF